jgi:hypothetical protein
MINVATNLAWNFIYMLKISNIVRVQNFEVISNKFNIMGTYTSKNSAQKYTVVNFFMGFPVWCLPHQKPYTYGGSFLTGLILLLESYMQNASKSSHRTLLWLLRDFQCNIIHCSSCHLSRNLHSLNFCLILIQCRMYAFTVAMSERWKNSFVHHFTDNLWNE